MFALPFGSSSINSRIGDTLVKKFIWRFPIILLAIVFGFRYGVGVDYFSYEDLYFSQRWHSIFEGNSNEYIFSWIYCTCYKLGLPYTFVQIVLNFIFFFFFYKSFEDEKKIFFWLILFFFFTGVLFLYLNIQRQGIALAILIYSVRYIKKKRFYLFSLCVLGAMGFHFSALLFFPIYFIWSLIKYLKRRSIQLTLWAGSLIFSATLVDLFSALSIVLLEGTKYGRYGASVVSWEMDRGSGIGYLIRAVFDLFVILYSRKLLNYYGTKSYFAISYFIFFIGCLLSNIFQYNLLLSRFAFLFVSFRMVVLAYIFEYIYLCKKRNDVVVASSILIIGFVYFLGMIYLGNNNCSPFQFVSCCR